MDLWIFAYGSLLWRPGFRYDDTTVALIQGWERRFWQGSPNHRGTPSQPGRVVTLIPAPAATCTGRLYRVPSALQNAVLEYLDHRESGGYTRVWVTAHRHNFNAVRALTYIAFSGNPHYLGVATDNEIEQHIARSNGPSGDNDEYLHLLLSELDALGIGDEERRVLPAGSGGI